MLVPIQAKAMCKASPGGLYGTAKWPLYRAWVKLLIDHLKASGVDYRIEIQNEFSILTWDSLAPQPAAWYELMVSAVKANGVPESRIIHSASKSGLPIVKGYTGGIYSMHQIEQPGMFPTSHPTERLMLSGDGGYAGKFPGRSATDYDSLGHRGISVEDGIALARMEREKGIMGGYEIMIKSLWREDDYLANLNYLQTDVLEAVTAEWAK